MRRRRVDRVWIVLFPSLSDPVRQQKQLGCHAARCPACRMVCATTSRAPGVWSLGGQVLMPTKVGLVVAAPVSRSYKTYRIRLGLCTTLCIYSKGVILQGLQ